jgi:hypothetical protein
VELGRQPLQQPAEGAVDLPRLDDVVVVEHQDAAGTVPELIEQRRQERLRVLRQPRRGERRQQTAADPGQRPLQGGDQIGEEAAQLAVGRIERSQAAGRSRYWSQSLIRADLPKPAGAETNDMAVRRPASRRSNRRRRCTRSARGAGAWSLVRKRGVESMAAKILRGF